jgi:predicted MFS family arabinose efflux permease
MLAAALLTVVSFPVLFGGTVIGFVASAALVLTVTLPSPAPTAARGIWDRTTRGIRLYLATPRLRGVLALNLSVAAAGAMVIVNTVVLVKGLFGLGEAEVALALGAFGAGSMAAALILPRLLERSPDRPAMIAGAIVLTLGTFAGPLADSLPTLMALWLVVGFGYSLTQTPIGRLLRRSATSEDRPAIFAAQFALSHACWLLTYPLAGRFGTSFGLDTTFVVMGAISVLGVAIALFVWPGENRSGT